MQNVKEIADYEQQEYFITSLLMSKCELYLPQSDVISVESIYELDKSHPQKMSVGSIKRQGKLLPVYALSSSLGLLLQIPEKRAQCALIRHSEGEYFLLCEEVSNFQTKHISFHEVPACMRSDIMPLTHLALRSSAGHNGKVSLISNGDVLYHSIAAQIEAYRHD